MAKHMQMATDSAFTQPWSAFSQRLDELNRRLVAELETCWQDLQAILENPVDQPGEASALAPSDLQSYQMVREQAGHKLLDERFALWERKRPYKRALMAIEGYDQRLDELINSLPGSISISGKAALAVFAGQHAAGLTRAVAAWRRKPRPLPLKAIVADECHKLSWRRVNTEGEYLLVIARGISQLKAAWEIARARIDGSVAGNPLSNEEADARRIEAMDSIASLKLQAEQALSAWQSWPQIIVQRLHHRILSGVVRGGKIRPLDIAGRRASYVNHWVAQLRALENDARLEPSLKQVENSVLSVFRRELDSLDMERRNLLAELDEGIIWLREQIAADSRQAFPPPKTDVIPTFNRMAVLEDQIKQQLQTLPASCKIPARLSVSSRRTKWRRLDPQDTFYQAFTRTGQTEIAETLQEIESEHRRIVHRIERAREVIAFGQETNDSEAELDEQIKREALQNALSLLEFQRDEARDWRASADARLARALASVFVENRLILSRHRLGAFAHLARQGLHRALPQVSRSTVETSRKALRDLLKIIERLALRFLIRIGWRPAPQAGKMEVIARPVLPQEFTIDLSTKDLPAIYRRLFRYEAVQDPRFLVGRERELNAIAEARAFWEAGRPASLIIVGERGSGKTSLINCAVKQCLDGLEVMREEFATRLVTEPEMRRFLAAMMKEDDPVPLESFLADKRRVIILEELERTFLRQVGYYPVIRALQELISATCSSTLWILATNQIAFRFLDAAVSLGDSFSHRINVASIKRAALRQAVLLRHNLSGLRLHFALPPPPRNFLSRTGIRMRGEGDAETLFFDALAKESAGVFRTAFEIWQSHIDTVEGGVLYMKALVTPDLSPIIDDLDLDDLFTLVAILQHGSLTAAEHALVFQRSAAMSRAQIDELLAREIIEPDPGRPGFRVRPEAMRVVKEALYRRNLL